MALSYLEKVLRHAEKELLAEAQWKPTDLLDLYRRFLKIEEHRLKLAHASGEGGREVCRRRSQLIGVILRDVWERALQHVVHAHGKKAENPEMFLAAVGGFGRGELNPFSDVDILFLYAKDRRTPYRVIEDLVEQVLYMLWDVGFKVGHSSRTLSELVTEANANLETKTALLESRFLSGDRDLWGEFEKTFAKECVKKQDTAYVAWRIADQAQRHQKYGGTVFVQEPNVKSGCGGLRDYQNLLWVAHFRLGIETTHGLQEKGLLYPAERKQIEEAYDFILHLRSEMHYLQKRGSDQLTLELQGRVANSLKYPQANVLRRTEALMREYYNHAHNLYLICNALAKRIAKVPPARPRWAFLTDRARKVDVFTLKSGEISIAEPELLTDDPLLLVRVFLIAQQHDAEIGPHLALRIRRRLRHIDRALLYRKETREMLFAIMRSKGKVGRVFRRMHELGVLGRLFPEFAPLTCLVQHEFFHRYTADEHTLVCLEMLDRIIDATAPPFSSYQPLMQKLEKPHILYLAMLLHDTGKSKNKASHSEEGAANAVRVARRLRLPAGDLATLVFLVDHHLTLSETARRKNPDDEETILEFARIVQTQERLDMLMLLTFADNEGTSGSRQWSDWKELVLWQLYRRTEMALSGSTEFQAAARKSIEDLKFQVAGKLDARIDPGEVEVHFQGLPERYFRAIPEDEIVGHINLIHLFLSRQVLQDETALKPCLGWKDFPQEGYSSLSVVSWDREKLFAKLTGAFAAVGCSILSADIYTRADNIIIDVFRFSTDRYQAVTDERDKKKLVEIIEAALVEAEFDYEPLIDRQPHRFTSGFEGQSFPTRIDFDSRSSSEYTLLDLQTPDRPGLLYDIAVCLGDFRIDIAHARIATEKGAALDTFYLTDDGGRKLDDTLIAAINDALKKKLAAVEAVAAPAP